MALRSVASQTTAGASVNVTKPSGTADGDVLVAVITSNDGGGSTLTFPAGFVPLTGSPVFMTAIDGQTFGVALKVASSEGASYDFSTNDGTCIAAVAAFSGRDPSTTPHRQSVTGETNGGGTNDVVITSTAFATATSVDHCDIVWISTVDPSGGTPAISFTQPSGYNGAVNITDGGGSGIGLANLDDQSSGVTGSTTADCVNNGNRFANFMIALAASAGAPTLDQSGFRFYADDGDEASSTPSDAENTGITAPAGETRRVRVQVDATGDPATTAFTLQFRKAGGTWADVVAAVSV